MDNLARRLIVATGLCIAAGIALGFLEFETPWVHWGRTSGTLHVGLTVIGGWAIAYLARRIVGADTALLLIPTLIGGIACIPVLLLTGFWQPTPFLAPEWLGYTFCAVMFLAPACVRIYGSRL